jgi:molecular chaperone GrpE
MQKNRSDEENQAEEIRIKDRRRINLDKLDNSESSMADDTASSKFAPSYVEQLETRARTAEQKLVEVQARFDQLRAELQRETDQVRQRLNRAADERTLQTKTQFVNALLPALDNLQRAIDAASNGSSLESLMNGLRGTVSGFESALASIDVETINSVGEKFDPEKHEAVDTIVVEEERDGVVTAEYSRGYRIGERLLRPARVQVGRAKAEAQRATD